jgi:uncharacterized iron-regulated membrane protein
VRVFFVRSRATPLRKAIFQIHLWTGLAVCVWVVLVCTTGSALVFRVDMQRAMFPHLFVPGAGMPADAATVLERVSDAFPGHQIYGIDAPSAERPTTIAYIAHPRQGSRVVLIDPATAGVLGELPQRSFLNTLGGLHANLLAGRPGRIVNGIGSLLLLVLCATGLVIWWPGIASWRSGFVVNVRRSWRRVNWELHGAVGIWTVALIAVWAATGVFFAAHAQVQSLVNAISPLITTVAPTSNRAAANASRPSWRQLIERAEARVPGQHVVRVVPPGGDRDPFQVAFSPIRPAPVRPGQVTLVYLDQYTGEVLKEARPADRSAGDIVIDWMGPLHVGNFAGRGVQIVWFVAGLAPAVLAVTGFVMWWSRVVRPRMLRVSERS